MEYYKQSRRRGISYILRRDGRLTGLVTLCVETAFYYTLLKKRWKEGQLSLEGVEEDVSSYLVTLRKQKDTGT
jgi:hypothetical protein